MGTFLGTQCTYSSLCGRRRGALRDVAHQLLRRGADPNVSSIPLPPLLLAVQSGDVDIVKDLLLAKADPLVTLPLSVRLTNHHHHHHHHHHVVAWLYVK